MNTHRSWIFILLVLLHNGSFAFDAVERRELGTDDGYNVGNRTSPSVDIVKDPVKPHNVAPIVGGVVGAVFLLLLLLLCYLKCRPRKAFTQLEDGIEKPQLSGRQWFGQKPRKDIVAVPPFPPKTATKSTQIPHFLKTLGRRSTNPMVDRPMPPQPAIPRSARLIPADPHSSIMFSLPSPSFTDVTDLKRAPSLTESLRSLDRSDRRKVQIASQPVVLGHYPTLGSNPRKNVLAKLFRFGAKPLPTTPGEIAKQMQEKQEAVAELEAKSRMPAYNANSGSSTSATLTSTVPNVQMEQDIAELRQEVKLLEHLSRANVVIPR